jgi:hypothetical protein
MDPETSEIEKMDDVAPREWTTAQRIKAERIRLHRDWHGSVSVAARSVGLRPDSYRQLEGHGVKRVNPSLATLAKLVRAGFELRAIAPELFVGE